MHIGYKSDTNHGIVCIDRGYFIAPVWYVHNAINIKLQCQLQGKSHTWNEQRTLHTSL